MTTIPRLVRLLTTPRGSTLQVGRRVVLTAHYTPTLHTDCPLRIYVKRNQLEIGYGKRGWTVVTYKSDFSVPDQASRRVKA